MVKFAYNNNKNANTSHTLFKLNCGFYYRVFIQKDINPYSMSCSAKNLAKKQKNIILICQKNLFYIQNL